MDPSPSLTLRLPGEADTLALGRALASILADPGKRAALLLRGDLGSGKTTLVRGLAEALPGGDEAEVASPSFNIVNVYPTRPEVFHVDLYRIPGGDPCVEEHLEAARLLFRIKNHTVKFLAGLSGASQLRLAINSAATIDDILTLLEGGCDEEEHPLG